MKIFQLFTYYNIMFFIIKYKIISCFKISFEITNNAKDDTNNVLRNLGNTVCNIKNCLLCDQRNECIKCYEGYELDKRRCYNKNCEIYGFCKFCDEYDCLKCQKGYKLNYGLCIQKEHSRKKIFILSIISFSIIILIIYICYRYHKTTKEKIKTGQILKFVHPKSGYYQLNFETNINENNNNTNNNDINNSNNNSSQETSHNKSLGTSTSESTGGKETPIINCCVVCGNKKTYTIADCGCSVCLKHFKSIKYYNDKILCRIHKSIISCNISFKMVAKSSIKGNAVKKLGLQICPICKLNNGTQSFNCGCPMRVCENCFNDNVYVFKYNQCPGCGMPYSPIKSNKKRKQ